MTKVAIQGELGSNSHMAVREIFGEEPVEIVSCAASSEVFAQLANGAATYAVLPIENSLHGSVFEHYDLLLEHAVQVVAERLLHIQHNVIAAPGVRLDQIRRVLSHPVALSQCRHWLRSHPAIDAQAAYDTAGSVKQLMQQGSRDAAGIAPRLAAEQYGAEILVAGVEDHPENYTRFYLLQPGGAGERRDGNKLSLAFSLDHRPGTLIAALGVLSCAGINLTKIESRPVPGRPWEYVFFVDLRFGPEIAIDAVLQKLGEHCVSIRELGRYRAAEISD